MTEILATVIFLFSLFFLLGSSVLGWSIFDWCSVDWYRIIYFSSSWRCNDNNYMDGGLELDTNCITTFIWMGEILYKNDCLKICLRDFHHG